MGKRSNAIAKVSQAEELHFEEIEDSSSDEEENDDLEAELPSDSEHNSSDDGSEEINEAITDYYEAVAARQGKNASGDNDQPPSPRPITANDNNEDDPASDSSEDERPNTNTVGQVPLEWYNEEEHIGYDIDGNKIIKKGRRDALQRFLARADSAGRELRTVYDEYNDEEIVLTKEELAMIQRIRQGKFPHTEANPFEPENDWFTRNVEVMPLSGAPEPKRRFIPSKWEEMKVVKLVRALRKGWIKKDQGDAGRPETYLLWDDDGKAGNGGVDKTAAGLTYIPAPKAKLPGHAESYNPPKEYLPTEEEKAAFKLLDEEDRPAFLPVSFDALRRVPAYDSFIKERFERCLDLYLCPRTRRKRIIIDNPENLVPQLPKPKDLQPFPSQLSVRYVGHQGAIMCLAPDSTGQWLLTGSRDGRVRLWEVSTGRCMKQWCVGNSRDKDNGGGREAVTAVAWCPRPSLSSLAAAAVGKRLLLLPTGTGSEEVQFHVDKALSDALKAYINEEGAKAVWRQWSDGEGEKENKDDDASPPPAAAVEILHKFQLKHVTWHGQGDYFATVAPTGNTAAVLVHQLSKAASQNPFRKNRGRVVRVLFHPIKPFFFVASQQHVRIYNLTKQALAKKLLGSNGLITSMAIHPTGDHLIVGSEDRRVAWYDLDLSNKPYKALRHHTAGVRGAAFHKQYPMFASSSDDGAVHVFHGMVYADLMSNPLIVPVKILKGHKVVDSEGVLDVAFHPKQPWVFTAGADGVACLFVNA
jgi:ribosome biogenesis protein ERB1